MRRGCGFLVLFVLAAGLSACETSFEVDLPEHRPVLVVNALANSDSVFSVHVSASYALSSERDPELTDASVELFENGQFVERLAPWRPDDSGELTPPWVYNSRTTRPVPGRVYTVRVSAPGLSDVEATDTVPAFPSVAIIETTAVDSTVWEIEYETTIRLTDTPGRHFYVLTLDERRRAGRPDSPVIQDYVTRQSFESSDPVLRESGGLGDLEEGGESRYDVAYFSDVSMDGETHEFKIRHAVSRFGPSGGHPDGYWQRTEQFVNLRRISQAYYQYMRAASVAGDDNPFAEPALLPSNVQGGLGIFAASSGAPIRVTDQTVGTPPQP